ncbi:aminodeoxychorismate synthase component I [Chitinivibrio alkaliphilus]|uniref:Para-aminobenzoate synthase component I n=1 Tax=Chitinivibrio alkaliphilus ACht1 TaxID=1313304 RepID=U7D9D8_9BACT|nr:aminodeoxychorismate synthase component I [Chitinivibrio alkaliphilus]ERP32196.1 para-aminobenzoate synthase component I [Chitinivibrio alkaliphilus ACht1]
MKEQLNRWGAEQRPFLLLLPFDGTAYRLHRLDQLPGEIQFRFPHALHERNRKKARELPDLSPVFMSREAYSHGFYHVQKHLIRGNTYLANYTCETPLNTRASLEDIYENGVAKYAVLLSGECTFFSPETFIRIKEGVLSTYPMKGTIDASVPNARMRILADKKEAAEHATIVDLLRNDLSMVARHVRVTRFRYVEQLNTSHKSLLQVSSHIEGVLPPDWRTRLGDILLPLVPAGSISGAPKQETLRIIREAEGYSRGFYTGITLLFDGTTVDSCVNIRFIQKGPDGLLRYRSGGGITAQSRLEQEYAEMRDKVYVPLD